LLFTHTLKLEHMKKTFLPIVAVVLVAFSIVACKKDVKVTDQKEELSQDVLTKIQALGFGTSNVQKHEDGYLVEGDIVLTPELLNSNPSYTFLRIANSEQYRTTNLVTRLPRNITVSMSTQLPLSYVAALDEAIDRYTKQKLQITFQRVSSGAQISIIKGNGSYLASAGFPTSSGDPYNQIKVNSRAIGNQPQATVASIIAHEMGHCIGFRHTDYMDRSFSCGGSPTNEGASTVGAIQIPGTPAGPDPNSWMLSCIGSGQNRPFNSNDVTALNYLY
jgi:predicted small secreted protein